MSYPKEHIRIDGPATLLNAAHAEALATKLFKQSPNHSLADCLRILKTGELYFGIPTPDCETGLLLTLPADWDKLMGILAELKKPKLPEYVRGIKGKVYKVKDSSDEGLWVYDCYGSVGHLAAEKTDAPITEQEFIDGGLKELAKAGYAKGAKVTAKGGDSIFTVNEIQYRTPASLPYPISIAVGLEKNNKGFCFSIETSGGGAIPVGICTLIPALPTTSQGIPYQIERAEVYYGTPGTGGKINVQTLRYLLKRGVTELVTKAGRLTKADLELLTK